MEYNFKEDILDVLVIPRVRGRAEPLTVPCAPCSVSEHTARGMLNARCSPQSNTRSVTFTVPSTDRRRRKPSNSSPSASQNQLSSEEPVLLLGLGLGQRLAVVLI